MLSPEKQYDADAIEASRTVATAYSLRHLSADGPLKAEPRKRKRKTDEQAPQFNSKRSRSSRRSRSMRELDRHLKVFEHLSVIAQVKMEPSFQGHTVDEGRAQLTLGKMSRVRAKRVLLAGNLKEPGAA